ncbi:alpha/beta fold hydrolase, partial [Acinetobacter baumannii]|nr:alpha/beta hydrolase [Acinetobacter baumannii]EJX0978110.1 alpha/beta hydrolase [Acinetobacter baumannii]EKV2615392.1 alpha/beta hydrolase [Acinetobacter baumannii]
MILKRIDMLLSYSRLEELNSIQHSALVIGANDDYVIPFLHSKQLFQAISNAQLVELSGGHFTPKVKPAAYAEIVNKFWESM